MRPDRTAAQVLFILYAVGVALAVPAGVRERYRDPAEDVRARGSSDEPGHTWSNLNNRDSETGSVVEPDNRFFDKALRTKIFRYTILGTVAGLFSGVASDVQKEIFGTVAPGAETVGRDLASGDVIGRGVQTQPRKNPVSI